MKTLEIIQLRLAGKAGEDLCSKIREAIITSDGVTGRVRVFQREGLNTDIAIHIQHDEGSGSGRGRLGVQLASELKTYGLVQHTTWKLIT